MVKYVETRARTLFKGGKVPARPNLKMDSWFWIDAYFNPYRGCEHACQYCDGLNEYYHVDHAFSDEVHVKINAPELLERELRRSGFTPLTEPTTRATTLDQFFSTGKSSTKVAPERRHGLIGPGGGVSDEYCPAEAKYEITRRCLEILRDFGFPVHIVTKSDLVLRDLDILKQIKAQTFAMVSFSLSTVDEDIKVIFEPHSPPAHRRLDAMQQLANAGITTGTTYMPVIPFITDAPEQLRTTLEAVKAHGGQYYVFGGMTMKGGRQADTFFKAVETHFPDQLDYLKQMYASKWYASRDYYRHLAAQVHAIGQELGLRSRAPRYFPPEEIQENLTISTALFIMAYHLQEMGIQSSRARAFMRAANILENLTTSLRSNWGTSRLPAGFNKGPVFKELAGFFSTGQFPSWETSTGAYRAYLEQ